MSVHSKPWTTTEGGHVFWVNIREDKSFIMQEHKQERSVLMPRVWPYSYRIISRDGRGLAASANTRTEIEADWELLRQKYSS